MSGYPGGHAGLLVAAITAHVLVGYALGAVLVNRPWAGVAGAVVADLDLLVPRSLGFPLSHRSLTHAPLVAVVVVAAVVAVHRRTGTAFGVGYASQLLIDFSTEQGIPLFYPISETFVSVPLSAHSPGATVLLSGASLALVAYDRYHGFDLAIVPDGDP